MRIKKYQQYNESIDDSETMARHQLFGADTTMAFSYDRQLITDPSEIKMLISKYNDTCIINKEWLGGPVNEEFIKFFQKYISDKSNSDIVISRKAWKPEISLMIDTSDYGRINLGFSLKTKKCASLNWKEIGLNSAQYDENVINEIYHYANTKIYKTQLKIGEAIELLRLNVLNEIEWDWID